MNHYCDIWFWRASDQEAVARHLRDYARTTDAKEMTTRANHLEVLTLVLVAAVMLAASLLILITVAEPSQAVPRDKGKIAFASDRMGNPGIWVMNADGTNPVQLTTNSIEDLFIAWSPDSRRLAFSRTLVPGDLNSTEIFVMNADGTGQTQLTFSAGPDIEPTWSPDGSKIAFLSRRDNNREIYVMNPDGSSQTNLTNSPTTIERDPDWAPDGQRIAFSSNRSGAFAVYTMQPDGMDVRKLTDDNLEAFDPAWSPNSDKLAFSDNGCFTCEESDLFVIEADGTSAPAQLFETPENETGADWSPDGKRIAFERLQLTGALSAVPNSGEIYAIGADGGGLTNLTNQPGADDMHPAWSPK